MAESAASAAENPMLEQGQNPLEERKWIKRALAANIVIAVATWILLLVGSQGSSIVPISEVVVVGLGLMLVAFITFGGFYLSSPPTATSRDPWMRNAIAGTFVLYYLYLLSYLLVAKQIRATLQIADSEPALTSAEFQGFSTFVGIVLAFYFATQVAERITETVQSGQTTRAALATHPEVAQRVISEQALASYRGGPPF